MYSDYTKFIVLKNQQRQTCRWEPKVNDTAKCDSVLTNGWQHRGAEWVHRLDSWYYSCMIMSTQTTYRTAQITHSTHMHHWMVCKLVHGHMHLLVSASCIQVNVPHCLGHYPPNSDINAPIMFSGYVSIPLLKTAASYLLWDWSS